MLPSLVVDEVRHGVAETLRVQFEPSTELFKDAVRRLIEEPSWIKGPYVHLGMPFVSGSKGKGFFKEFETEHPAFLHQEQAWQRCGVEGRSTLVATGTGSGKTECFLYPVLEQAAQARQQGAPGIKAIIIYPMNALADDQAKRIAELVHKTPAFAGLRAGLFVGSGKTQYKPGKAGKSPEQDATVMGPDHVIADKDVLRDNPPDILLTNYKMLDFLLIRPKDQPLWRDNGPETLRYLVVDELHTFDGAQGTDLAMLIRRLRHRLKCDAQSDRGRLICIGTSATLGDASDTAPLRDYASQVFATDFDRDAVIVERRQGFDAFIGDKVVEHLIADDETVLEAIRPESFDHPQEAVARFLPAFFASPETLAALLAGLDTPLGRIRLGEELKKHLLFQSLLRTATQAPVTVDAIADKLQRTLSARVVPEARALISALLTLVAWARAPHAGQKVDASTPVEDLSALVTLRVQLWLQELRRVLATVSRDPAEIVLCSEAAVLSQRERLRLPLVQCRHCHATGWLTVKQKQDSRVVSSLDRIYGSFFARYQDTFLARIYPGSPTDGRTTRAPFPLLSLTLCGQCGHLGHERLTQCPHCQSDDVVPVEVANATRTKPLRDDTQPSKKPREVTVHDDRCPVCGERGGQLIVGAQTTSLAAHAVERLWSARLNDHKKLILFSDSVQDAAHRAGYIESKTEGTLMRAGLAKVLATLPAVLPWDQALDAIGRGYLDPSRPLAMSPRDFVARFIPPSMEWLRDWRALLETTELPPSSRLPSMLSQRMQWRAVEELAHRSDRGRTLTRVGIAVLFPDLADLQALSRTLTPELCQAGGGLEALSETQVLHWTLGTVLALIRAGAIFHMELERFAETGDFAGFEFAKQRKDWIPHRGHFGAPRFVTRESGRHGFMHLEERDTNPLLGWAKLALGLTLSSPGIVTLAYEELLKALEQAGLGRFVPLEHKGVRARVFGLLPSRLSLYRDPRRLVTSSGAQSLWVPAEAVEALGALPAWNSPGETFRPEADSDSGHGASWWHTRFQGGDVTRVIAHEHTGLLERDERVALQNRFMATKDICQPWYENLLSATPTLEMGINIGTLSSVMLGGVPPNQANFIQRIGRAGRRDGNAAVFAIADASPDGHDQYYFANPLEMLHGDVEAPAIYLNAAEVLRRQLYAFFFDHWVAEERPELPDRLSEPLDQVAKGDGDSTRFPFNYLDFVNRHEPALFDAFCRMLADALRPETRAKLETFITGTDRHKHLRVRFLAFFEETHAERESWKKRRKAINTELQRLRKRPEDEQTLAEIDLLDKERAGLGQRIQQLNNEYLLEALTNAGLLPNYAFPEEGVALTTIIHGSRSSGEEYSVPVHRYSRPAHAALAEFAPRNTFFAHKSKVEIDQIDMSVEPPAEHRFCAGCHYLKPLTAPEAKLDACPRCGDSHWVDGSQVRPILRLKRAVANIHRANKIRITETDEARNPKFYARRLLMNFAAEDVRTAWTLESSQAIYGFEFIATAAFHDLNLGQPLSVDSAESATLIAGDDSAKAGFALCQSCGMVQTNGGRGREETRTQVHTPDCPDRHAKGTEHLLDRLFLYRQFESECLRIMVPKGFGSGERTTYSFMSALQLGLRKRFGGKVDHLRFETMSEAGTGDGAGKTYILIYDSVPGGTGYLQQLLAGNADTLTEVLATAHGVIRDCACQVKPEQDGCYQCVFHYRQGRNRRHISRAAALEMLDELVQGEFQRKEVKCLSEIYINPSFGSELERRFLPGLKALGGQLDTDNARLPPVRVTQDIKAGKTAYLLTVGPNKYWVDTQVPIEDPVSGHILCQPDFVISKTLTASPMRPIAVFVDGWEHHQKCMPDDARKRATLMLRGDYRVWSVTFEDIDAAHKLKGGTDLESPLSVLMTDSGQQLPADRLPPFPQTDLMSNAMGLLLHLLGQPLPVDQDPLDRLRTTGAHLLMRSVLRPNEVTEAIKASSAAVSSALPEWLRLDAQTVHLHSPGKGAVQWIGRAEPKFLTGKSTSGYPFAGALVLDDVEIAADLKLGRAQWRQWLRLANLLQGVPGVALLTRSMLDTGETLAVLEPRTERPTGESAGWTQILEAAEFLERLAQGFGYLAQAGVPAPDGIGVEYEDGDDYRLAEALWERARLVFLTSAQAECVESWTEAGYKVMTEAENWWLDVEAALKGQTP
ncbi:DEAD/DEAH box helicase [Thiorhodococcus mannitoliphagus]|uniref:DEAD/DEAH box helicase n=1 Tax=Thiorhodococcus mannitoliphagus TaxID=329406 RepID=A0A6P1DXN0_9GAMM|nr:DEAD/DEAH box helicase [Thiorhodococcus mannitoliphagus]NEX22948.1 DEAD/DEAH box helicase [Thiorhodococcus mannitoliphagus]